MSLMKMITENPQLVEQMARQFGLSGSQSESALGALAGAVTRGVKKNSSRQGGLESLMSALGGGNHRRYVERPDVLERPESVSDGNAILGHIFGSKQVSRQVAQHASEQTGVGTDILKKMLPLVAGMVMGNLNKETSNSGLLEQFLGGGSSSRKESSLGGLAAMLDSDDDGSIADDLLGMAGKLFG